MPSRFLRRALGALLLSLCAAAGLALPAGAHGFTSVVYVDLTEPFDGVVRAELELEYVLLVMSAAEAVADPGLESRAKATFKESGADPVLLAEHGDTVLDYVTERFTVTADGRPCSPTQQGPFGATERDGVPHAVVVLDFACSGSSADPVHEISSGLFPESEGFVGSTETIVEYDLPAGSGSAVLTADAPAFSSDESSPRRLGEFFVLGAEHLLFGLDHVLFLLALIVGSRRVRDVLLTATAFTAAHSVTFVLAALGLVSVPAAIVEPVIALSIAVVAAWHVWVAWRGGGTAPRRTVTDDNDNDNDDDGGADPRPVTGLGGAGTATLTAPAPVITVAASERPRRWSAAQVRLAVVFAFGLIHGLGFAGALGIDEPFSWSLLGSLLVFNLGIEVVQVAIIAAVFPLLLTLQTRLPLVGHWCGVVVAGAVAMIGLYWFAERLLGLG